MITMFSTKPYDREFFDAANADHGVVIRYLEPRLTLETAPLAAGAEAVCVFVNDILDDNVLSVLSESGCKTIALRCAGFNNVNLPTAAKLGLRVVRVPAYSPYAVAEHAVALILALNRKIHRAYNRVREGNFALNGLLGFDLHGRTVGIIGTGQIGLVLATILKGFGCRLLGYDPSKNPQCEALGMQYVPLDDLYASADIITLNCPLTPQTHHLINADSIAKMKRGVMLINTSRGGVVDTKAVIAGLKSQQIGSLGLDVYEEEAAFFFEDRSATGIPDDVLARLFTFPNVLITGHQGFFTEDALRSIATTTLGNIVAVQTTGQCPNEVKASA